MKGFINILAVSGSGEGFRTNEENMINLIGLLRRLFPFLSSALIRTIGWIFYGLALLSMSIYFWRNGVNLSENEISLTAVAAILFSPHSHAQDLILLIAPILPADGGNGLAMRMGVFADALAKNFELHVLVIPIAGELPSGPARPKAINVHLLGAGGGQAESKFALLSQLEDPAGRLDT